jgi:hypothetical protein
MTKIAKSSVCTQTNVYPAWTACQTDTLRAVHVNTPSQTEHHEEELIHRGAIEISDK